MYKSLLLKFATTTKLNTFTAHYGVWVTVVDVSNMIIGTHRLLSSVIESMMDTMPECATMEIGCPGKGLLPSSDKASISDWAFGQGSHMVIKREFSSIGEITYVYRTDDKMLIIKTGKKIMGITPGDLMFATTRINNDANIILSSRKLPKYYRV